MSSRDAQLSALIHKLLESVESMREIRNTAVAMRVEAADGLEAKQLHAVAKLAASTGNTFGAVSRELRRHLPQHDEAPKVPIDPT